MLSGTSVSLSSFLAQFLIPLLTLSAMEIILGVDNVVFLAILTGKLPEEQQARARRLGILLAVGTRLLLLLSISFLMRLTQPLFVVFHNDFSGRDLALLVGGLFLIAKSTFEIHDKLEGEEQGGVNASGRASFVSTVVQIAILDVVFSLDSVITAVGMSGQLSVMIPAVLAAALVILVFSGPICSFVQRHPTVQMLALSFLILIGVLLVVEAWDKSLVDAHRLRAFVYFAMGFSTVVELLNLRVRRKAAVVVLHNSGPPTLTPRTLSTTPGGAARPTSGPQSAAPRAATATSGITQRSVADAERSGRRDD